MLKYKGNPVERLRAAGWSSYRIKQEKKLSQVTLQKMREGDTSISVASLGAICDMLECQPGELLRWEPGEQKEGE